MEVLICRVERPLHVMWVGDLLAIGLIRHATPQQAVASADVTLSVLTDAEATLNVIQQIAVGCREGEIFCQMGTIGVGETREATIQNHILLTD
ncbi:TPA: hypothetical protein MB350_001635 [Klebsiella quasipneumoniae subsp. similipneumoniae]|nr:hypothetical protein [Klebsiella quasipneumoniae subsp. similipneumoniae]HBT4827303.1 hypothetical protein [Klebsiella quasipneumoniae subsp. similipneumoniae]